MNTLVVFSILVASCYAGGYKKSHGHRYGTCPYYVDFGAVGRDCREDYQCPHNQKCCAVGYARSQCQVPLHAQRPGRCPSSAVSTGYRYCNTDRDCPPTLKCCTGPSGDVNTCKRVFPHALPVFGGGVGPYPGTGHFLSAPLGSLSTTGLSGPVASVSGTRPMISNPGFTGSFGFHSGATQMVSGPVASVTSTAPMFSGPVASVTSNAPMFSSFTSPYSGIMAGITGPMPGIGSNFASSMGSGAFNSVFSNGHFSSGPMASVSSIGPVHAGIGSLSRRHRKKY